MAKKERDYARKVRIDRDGYAPNGQYFGRGAPVYEVELSDGRSGFVRAYDSAEAKAKARKDPYHWGIRGLRGIRGGLRRKNPKVPKRASQRTLRGWTPSSKKRGLLGAKKAKAPCLTQKCRERRAAQEARRKSARSSGSSLTKVSRLKYKTYEESGSTAAGPWRDVYVDVHDSSGARVAYATIFSGEVEDFEVEADFSRAEEALIARKIRDIAKQKVGPISDPYGILRGLRGVSRQRRYRRR